MKYRYKSFFLALVLILCFATLKSDAQQAKESIAELDHVVHPVFTTTFAFPAEIVEGALLEKLQKDHISAKDRRHSITCEGVVYPELSASPLDIYFQTEEKSRKEEYTTTLKMFVSKGRDNFIGEKYDAVLAQKALYFLNHLHDNVDQFALQKNIYEKEDALEGAREDYKDLLEDKQDLYDDLYDRKKELSAASGKDIKKTQRKIRKVKKKINRLENEISNAEKDMQQRKGEIQALRSRLSEMQDSNR